MEIPTHARNFSIVELRAEKTPGGRQFLDFYFSTLSLRYTEEPAYNENPDLTRKLEMLGWYNAKLKTNPVINEHTVINKHTVIKSKYRGPLALVISGFDCVKK